MKTILLTIFLLLMQGCGSSGGGGGDAGSSTTSSSSASEASGVDQISSQEKADKFVKVLASLVLSASDLIQCEDVINGALIYIKDEAQFVYCESPGSGWVNIDLKGAKGDKGDTGSKGDSGFGISSIWRYYDPTYTDSDDAEMQRSGFEVFIGNIELTEFDNGYRHIEIFGHVRSASSPTIRNSFTNAFFTKSGETTERTFNFDTYETGKQYRIYYKINTAPRVLRVVVSDGNGTFDVESYKKDYQLIEVK